jgi:hypothetical protein
MKCEKKQASLFRRCKPPGTQVYSIESLHQNPRALLSVILILSHLSLQYAQHVMAVSPQSYIRLVIYSQRKHPYGLQTCYRQLRPLHTSTCCSRPDPGYMWFTYVNAISKPNSPNWMHGRILKVTLSEWANIKKGRMFRALGSRGMNVRLQSIFVDHFTALPLVQTRSLWR